MCNYYKSTLKEQEEEEVFSLTLLEMGGGEVGKDG
jgi:hypothetical protein